MQTSVSAILAATLPLALAFQPACLDRPPPEAQAVAPANSIAPIAQVAVVEAPPRAAEPMAELDAWTAVGQMGIGVNIGNTLENTTHWETGWGNPPITQKFVDN